LNQFEAARDETKMIGTNHDETPFVVTTSQKRDEPAPASRTGANYGIG